MQWKEIIQTINCDHTPNKASTHEQIPHEALIYSGLLMFRIKLFGIISLKHVIHYFNTFD